MDKQAFDLVIKQANRKLQATKVAAELPSLGLSGLYSWAGRNPHLAAVLAGGAAGGLYGLDQSPTVNTRTGKRRGRLQNALHYGGAGLLGGVVGTVALPHFARKGFHDRLPSFVQAIAKRAR